MTQVDPAYRRLRRLIGSFLVLYFVGCVAHMVFPIPEGMLMPFFSWKLYARVPVEVNSVDVVIQEYHGQVFDPPRPLLGMNGLCPPELADYARQLVQRLSASGRSQDARMFAAARAELEAGILTPPVRYEVIERRYDPLVRWKTGELTVRSFGRFVGGKPE